MRRNIVWIFCGDILDEEDFNFLVRKTFVTFFGICNTLNDDFEKMGNEFSIGVLKG